MARSAAGLTACALIAICCGNYDIDVSFSEDLTILAQGFATRGLANPSTSVDAIRVYEVGFENRMLNLTHLESLTPLIEATDRQFIDRFFEAVQDQDRGIEGCTLHDPARIFHVLAIDDERDRPAAFQFFVCRAAGDDAGAVVPFGSAGVYYNRKLKPLLEAAAGEVP